MSAYHCRHCSKIVLAGHACTCIGAKSEIEETNVLFRSIIKSNPDLQAESRYAELKAEVESLTSRLVDRAAEVERLTKALQKIKSKGVGDMFTNTSEILENARIMKDIARAALAPTTVGETE